MEVDIGWRLAACRALDRHVDRELGRVADAPERGGGGVAQGCARAEGEELFTK